MHCWLARIDEAGVALVIDARNPALAARCHQNYRFHPVDTDPLMMYRYQHPDRDRCVSPAADPTGAGFHAAHQHANGVLVQLFFGQHDESE